MNKPKRAFKHWTKEEIALFSTGKNDQEIGLETGRTANCVSVKRSQLKQDGLIPKTCVSRAKKPEITLELPKGWDKMNPGQKAAYTRAQNKKSLVAVVVPEKTEQYTPDNAKRSTKDLSFIINGTPVTVKHGCKSVLVDKDRVQIDF